MSGCASCRPGGCHDHSSRAPQSPSLVDLVVVRGIFSQAVVNMFNRAVACSQGEMTKEELDKKDLVLTEWLGDTFCGHNSHFEEGPEDWNPKGLAEVLRGILADNAVWEEGEEMPEDDESVIFTACAVFVAEAYKAILTSMQSGVAIDDTKNLPPEVDSFVETWAMVFAGAPV